jgi:hypothetical protein
MSAGALSLSGAWTGVFDYSNTQDDAVTFTATLTDVGGVIWGTIREPNSFSPIAVTELRAEVTGIRSRWEVRFRKEYTGYVPGGEEVIAYAGQVAANGNRISGDWRIALPGAPVGGPFVMNRLPGLKATETLRRRPEHAALLRR